MAKATSTTLEVQAPKFEVAEFTIRGTTPYCQNRFGAKAIQQMRDQQAAGSAGKATKKRDAKDFDALYEDAKHKSAEGWIGIPAAGLRAAMISACRAANVVMTRAKLAVFVEADGFDIADGQPLVRITKGEPTKTELPVRNESGVIDIRPRPMWQQGWEAVVRIRYEADMITAKDVANLLLRVGMQVGIGEGRPDSRKSTGMGWGMFTIVNDE